MGAVEIGELANLIVDLALFPVVFLVLRRKEVPRASLILGACACVVTSHTATIVEGFAFPVFFDALEHLSILAAGLLFLAAFCLEARLRGGGGRR